MQFIGRLATSAIKVAAKPVRSAISAFRHWRVKRLECNAKRKIKKSLFEVSNKPAKGIRSPVFSFLQRVSTHAPHQDSVERTSLLANNKDQYVEGHEQKKISKSHNATVFRGIAHPFNSAINAFRRWRVNTMNPEKQDYKAAHPIKKHSLRSRAFKLMKGLLPTRATRQKLADEQPLLVDDKPSLESDVNGHVFPDTETGYQMPARKKKPVEVSITDGGQSIKDATNDFKALQLEKQLATGAVAVGAAAGVAVGAASALQPDASRAMFDHILQKDTPLDKMLVLSQHNALAIPGKGSLPFVATNQTMSIQDALEKTPVRAFELDLHRHNGEVVINHGGYFDPLVDDSNIPRLPDALNPINDWLDKSENSNEVIFLDIENSYRLNWHELNSALGDKVVSSHELSNLARQLGRAPTINEITADGPKVVILQGGHYHGAGHGSVDYYHGCSVNSVWEDRSLIGVAGPETHPAIADQITTKDIDHWLQGEQGGFIKLDQISANDPRFFKPEDRPDLALNPDQSILGALYHSSEDVQSTLLGIGVAASTTTGALGLAAGVYQGVGNERKIRGQDRLASEYLERIELLAILQARKNQKLPLDAAVSPEEIKTLYVKQEKGEITKSTVIPGISSTAAISGSLLSLGMLFPPAFAPFAIASAASGVAGALATLGAFFGNRRRLNKAIQKTFSHPDIEKKLATTASRLEAERKQMMPITQLADQQQSESLLQKTLAQRTKRDQLTKASQLMLGGTLVARISGIAKYGLPVIGTIAMGISAAITGILVGLSAIMNFKDRRQKLSNLPSAVVAVMQPNIDKKRFWLFGSTPYELFLKKNWSALQKEHSVLQHMSLKSALKNYQRADLAPDSALAEAFLNCRKRCISERWEKDLSAFLLKQKPSQDFDKVRKDPQTLRSCLKSFIIKRVGGFAHNDTFYNGRNNTLRLSLLSAFAGIFFFPMFAVTAGTLATGLGVSKAVAVYERRLFESKLREAFDNPGVDPDQKKAHQMLSGLISIWADRLSPDIG